jgi:hypothetical protein
VHYIRILCALYHVAHAATPNVATSTSIDWFASIPLVNARALEYIHRYTLLPSLSGSKPSPTLLIYWNSVLGPWALAFGPWSTSIRTCSRQKFPEPGHPCPR